MYRAHFLMEGFLGLALIGCMASEDVAIQTSATQVQEQRSGLGGVMGLDVLATSANGDVIPCGVGTLDVTIETSRDGGPYVPVNHNKVVVTCLDVGHSDVAVVVDNSGSESGMVPDLQTATRALVGSVLEAGGRASITRVSTNANTIAPLTNDAAALEAAVASFHASNGWTSLYDGVRMANQSLGVTPQPGDDNPVYADANTFCVGSHRNAIVLFTDGRENNSSDEHAATYDTVRFPGDRFATSLDDLQQLRVRGVTTPIYAVGLGHNIDVPGLTLIADSSGGRYVHIDSSAELPTVFSQISSYFDAAHQVCVNLPIETCGDLDVRVNYTWTHGSQHQSQVVERPVHIACPQQANGRIATILLTLSNPGITEQVAATLAKQAVDYVSPKPAPSVLMVLDDNHHGENANDPIYIQHLLEARGYQVTFMQEPAGGLRKADIGAHDVVWFSNPGYPMDDVRSVETLVEFSAAGGGVVLQGDDMTWSMGQDFLMTPLTHLHNIDNGTAACGELTDNNAGKAYDVTFDGPANPLTSGLAGTSFSYGDDIDQSTVEGAGVQVLATARLSSGSCTVATPAITVFDPHAP